jgi:hypothetical protein
VRTIWTSKPRPLSTNDGPRALVLFYGFQRQATTILKRLTPVTLFLHVEKAVHLKKARSRFAIPRRSHKHGVPARDGKSRKAKSKGHENRRKLRLPMQKAEKRCSVVAPIYGWSVASQSHDSHDGFIEVVVRMLYEGALDSSSGRLSRVDCLEGAPLHGGSTMPECARLRKRTSRERLDEFVVKPIDVYPDDYPDSEGPNTSKRVLG